MVHARSSDIHVVIVKTCEWNIVIHFYLHIRIHDEKRHFTGKYEHGNSATFHFRGWCPVTRESVFYSTCGALYGISNRPNVF